MEGLFRRKKSIKNIDARPFTAGHQCFGEIYENEDSNFIGLFLTLYLYYIRRLLTEFKLVAIFMMSFILIQMD